MCAGGRNTTEMHRNGSKEAHQPEDCLQFDPEKEMLEIVSKGTVSCCLLSTLFRETAYIVYVVCKSVMLCWISAYQPFKE